MIFGWGRKKQEAKAKAEDPEEAAEIADAAELIVISRQVMTEYGIFLKHNPVGTMVLDTARLPFPKDVIERALMIMLMTEDNPTIREGCTFAAMSLASFQDGVGDEGGSLLGFDPSTVDINDPNLVNIVTAGREARTRYQRFEPLVQADKERLGDLIADAKAHYRAQGV